MASVSPQSPFYRTTDASERAFGRNAPVADGGVFMRHEMLAVPGTGTDGNIGVALDANTVTVRVRVSPRLYAGRVAGIGFIAPAGAVTGTTYAAVVDGNTYAAVGYTTPKAVTDALRDAINAAAVDLQDSRAESVLWGAENGQADGTYALIVWNEGDLTATSPIAPALALNLTASGSTGAWAGRYMDAASIDFDVYEKHDGSPGASVPEPWGTFPGGELEGVTKPWTEKFNLAGASRVAVQVLSATADPGKGANMTTTAWAWISPAVAETVTS